MTGWQADKAWSDRFVPQIKMCLACHLIGEASTEDDQFKATDLVVLKMESVRIGCRLRREEHAVKYGNEFTIRTSRPSGNTTELEKIIAGWGNYFFYGFASDSLLLKWSLCDLNVFRLTVMRFMRNNNGKFPGILKDNHDGSSSFAACRFSEFPDEFVVASGVGIPELSGLMSAT